MQLTKLKRLIEDLNDISESLSDCVELDRKDLDDVIIVHGKIEDQIKPLKSLALELDEIRESVDQIWIGIERAQDEEAGE